jgi:hypothetical protein
MFDKSGPFLLRWFVVGFIGIIMLTVIYDTVKYRPPIKLGSMVVITGLTIYDGCMGVVASEDLSSGEIRLTKIQCKTDKEYPSYLDMPRKNLICLP